MYLFQLKYRDSDSVDIFFILICLNMRKLYYLTRSYPNVHDTGGGSLIREAAVELLRKNEFDVYVIAPNYHSSTFLYDEKNKVYQIPAFFQSKICGYFERVGIYEDYLDNWVKKAFRFLRDKIKKEDIIFSAVGGELGPIKLGSLLKERIKCKFVINFQDPLDYSLVNGKKLNYGFHVSREKQERKYCRNADLIVCSSKTNADSLKHKYPNWASLIRTNYFGYTQQRPLRDSFPPAGFRIVYGGNFGREQSPELLAEALERIPDVQASFIGKFRDYAPVKSYLDTYEFLESLPVDEYREFLYKHASVGFVSLADDYLGACVPSKIYEYINLGLPMLGALPTGDAMDIINTCGYGIACHYTDRQGLVNAIKKLQNKSVLSEYRAVILRDRDKWMMKERIKELVIWLNEI